MIIIYDTPRLKLITPHVQYLDSIVDYHKRNKDFLEIWEPQRPDNFYTRAYQKAWIKAEQREIKRLCGLCFLIVKSDEPWKVIGTVKLSNILYGNFCSCFLGYRLDNLHRVEASVIPSNDASAAVLKKAGFRYVGSSASYLKIYGEWQRHDIYEFINPSD